MRKIVVGKNDAGQRLDSFLGKLLKDAPKSLLYKWLRKKRIKVNSKKQEISYRLCEGDEILLYVNDEFFSEGEKVVFSETVSELKVCYEDENILIADKPKGMSVHRDGKNEENLIDNIRVYLYKKGEYNPETENVFSPQLCHRIDKNTSGLVIAAKNAEALRIINEKIKNREIRKQYLLYAEGDFKEKKGVIKGYTKKDEKTNTVKFSFNPFDGAKEAITEYECLEKGQVLAELKTGRTHQIRVSFSAIGHPLVGDVKYGAKKDGKKTYQNLRAYRIIFDFKTESGILEYLKGKEITAD